MVLVAVLVGLVSVPFLLNGPSAALIMSASGNVQWSFENNKSDQQTELCDEIPPSPAPLGSPTSAKKKVLRQYSYQPYVGITTTQERWGTAENVFAGDFAEIRKQVDLSYHGNYVPERQSFQDDLIREALGDVPSQERPWLVFMAGAMAVGKTYALNWLKKRVDLSTFVRIDPDEFTRSLPETLLMNAESVGQATRLEVGLLSELALVAALQRRKNVIVDTSFRHSHYYKSVIAMARAQIPDIRIGLIYVKAQYSTVLDREKRRSSRESTNRVVPEHVLKHALHVAPAAVLDVRS